MKTFDELYLEIEQEAIQNSCKNIFADMEKEKDHPLVLYGAGGNCEFALFTLATKAVKATCVCDSKATGVYQYKDKTYDKYPEYGKASFLFGFFGTGTQILLLL